MVRTSSDDRNEQRVISNIAEFGWHCVNIMADGPLCEYSFTVGLYKNYGHPELIIFGLGSDIAHEILTIAANAAKAGAPIDLSQTSDAFIDDYPCCFGEVPKSEYRAHVGYARWYYLGDSFPLYQIIWPSKLGVFPWHPQASEAFKAAQPVIALQT